MDVPLSHDRLLRALEDLADGTCGPGTVLICGGASAVLTGWRESTLDLDVSFDPEPPGIFDAIVATRRRTGVTIELAAPDHFVPALDGWRGRCTLAGQFGRLTVLHFDFYTQAFAKLARGFSHDLSDVRQMLALGLCDGERLVGLIERARPQAVKFPRLDLGEVKRRLVEVMD